MTEPPNDATPSHTWSTEVPISSTLAHVYTECARIWNPIHTDRAVARAAGLPDIILHGTATLALAISQTLRHDPRGPAAPVRALGLSLRRHGASARPASWCAAGDPSRRRRARRSASRRSSRTDAPRCGTARSCWPTAGAHREDPMTKLERVQAALKRQPTDRPPYAFWRHFPDVDRNPAALCQSTLRFHERYQSDFLKVTPTGGYAVEDWGCVESDEVRPDGHRPCARHAVNAPEDWKKIRPVRMESTAWASHLETIIRCVVDRRADCSTMPTVFSPLSLARKLSGDRLNYDLKENPQAVTDALEAITETTLAFAEACFREGTEGFFYSIQAASTDFHTEEEYRRFGEPYDRRILEAVQGKSKLTILHAHGEHLMFERLATLPAHAWNWDDRRVGPSLRDAVARVPGAVVGGLDQWGTLRDGSPEEAQAQVRDAIEQTGGRGLIVGGGCVLPSGVSDATLVSVIRALGGAPKLGLIRPQ